MITAADLLDLMPIVANRGWTIRGNGAIRDRAGRCPICALANEIDSRIDYQIGANAAMEPFLTPKEQNAVDDIVEAADDDYYPLTVRERLMQVLGMKK